MAKRIRSLMNLPTKSLTRREMKRLARKEAEKKMKEDGLTSPHYIRRATKTPAKKRNRLAVVFTTEVSAMLEAKGKKNPTAYMRRKFTKLLRKQKSSAVVVREEFLSAKE